MRFIDIKRNSQAFDVCVLLTRQECKDIINWMDPSIGMEAGEHIHVFDSTSPGVSGSRVLRELWITWYEDEDEESGGLYKETYQLLLMDKAGELEELGEL